MMTDRWLAGLDGRQAQRHGFQVTARLDGGRGGRAGVIATPHGDIDTPAFIPVGTKASVKAMLPADVRRIGAQAVLANAFHLYLQPGPDVIYEAGGLAAFMGWDGPTFTDSGGFQVMSLGAGFKKTIEMTVDDLPASDTATAGRRRLSRVDEDGVNFISPLDGSSHRFEPETSIELQWRFGADIMFAFDELTTLRNTRPYQEGAVARTQRWAQRCLKARAACSQLVPDKPYQALFGVVQGAQYEDLRRLACRDLAATRDADGAAFDGYGIGGALEKTMIGTIVGWCTDELPEDKPRHLLGISEPEDLFAAVEAGADTFDCVNPSRVARNAAIYTARGRYNITNARFKRDFDPLEDGCQCATCTGFTRAYVHHLFKAHELLANTLATIHNEYFTVKLVDDMRAAIIAGCFDEFRDQWLGRWQPRLP